LSHGGRKRFWIAIENKDFSEEERTQMHLSTSGLLFLIISWSVIISLNIFCFYNIFKESKEKIVDTIDLEAKIDEIDP
jgi:hypothetical protein